MKTSILVQQLLDVLADNTQTIENKIDAGRLLIKDRALFTELMHHPAFRAWCTKHHKEILKAPPSRPKPNEEIIMRAMNEYMSDTVHINPSAKVMPAPNGHWVEARVWVKR